MRWVVGLAVLGFAAWFPSRVVDALAAVHAYEECGRLRELHRFVALDCPDRPGNLAWGLAGNGLAAWWFASILGAAALVVLVNKRPR